jgi:hypothetical protein
MTTTVQDFFKEVYVKYKGKQSKVPALGTDKWLSAVITLQAKLREFATDPYHEWDSLHQDVNGGTVAVNNSTYDLDETIQRPSDKLVVTKNGQVTRISFIKLTQRWLPQYMGTGWAYLHGDAPQQVTVNANILAGDGLVGGTLTIPAYILPEILGSGPANVQPSDTILVDNIDWLVHAVAAEIARNDPAKRAQYPNLQGLSNTFWKKMCDSAVMVPSSNPDAVEADMPAMGGFC